MNRTIAALALLAAALTAATAQDPKPNPADRPGTAITMREVRYDATLGEHDARFSVDLDAECAEKSGGSLVVVEGDVAFVPAKLPDQLSIVREGNRYSLVAEHGMRIRCKLDFVAKVQHAEPWNQIAFTGPMAAIASVNAQASGAGMDVQLLTGTVVETVQTNGVSHVRGLLGSERTVSLRWQGKVTEVARKALLTADSTVTALITPTVVKYTTQIRYDILQGNAPRLTLALPTTHALTRLVGEQIRDWQLKPDGDRQILTVEFIKPAEKHAELMLFSEQTLDSANTAKLDPPQPLEVERETGSLTLNAEDMVAETDAAAGLRQVNAPSGVVAAYRFNGRPFTLALRLKRIEPQLTAEDRVTTRLEETRLLIAHSLALTVEKAGIYAVELLPQVGIAVTEVRGEGVEEWKVADGKLRVNFAARLLGARKLDVQLEQSLKTFPERITVGPLRVVGATKETAQIGAASAAGIRLKSGELAGLREVPVNRLANRSDELLAFTADQPDWTLTLASERLAARIVADVFNLVTIGDGLVGGSATIRYGIVNQGVQEFRVKLPAHCKNVEFTGPNIRRREQSGDTWTIGLQDKAWGGYTLVVTYDYQFDPKGTTLPVAGIHTLGVEHETGSVAITTAASLKLNVPVVNDPLRRVDESELAAADRALITRAVVLAYQYAGDHYDLAVDVKRHEQLQVLDAVADRTQITSVLTEAGEMLTQASFMVKNNAKQFQRFQLPAGSDFWSCYVNGEAVKPERDGNWVLVPLPREANRDQAFAVDIAYARTNAALNARWSQQIQFAAPVTDVPNTYAEWQLYVPASKRLSDFGGTMRVAEGTTYGALDAWQKFIAFYVAVLREAGPALAVGGVLAFLVVALVMSAAKRGGKGVVELLVVVAIMAILAGMMLPALSKAKQKAQRINSANNLKQIGLAARIWAGDNQDRFPATLDEMMVELGSDKVTYDPETGQRYTYLGAHVSETTPDAVLAYSPIVNGYCSVLFADGSVQQMNASKFAELAQRGLVRSSQEIAQRQQAQAVQAAQLQQPAANQPAAAQAEAAPRPRGLRSIRIELPREGNAFTFTKVLNLHDKSLSISAKLMPLETYRNVLMAKQVAAFLLGLAAWGWQWRGRRNSFILTCALALMLGSLGSLLVAWRALHDALIVGFPAVVLAAVSWLIWRATAKRRAAKARATETVAPQGGDLPPAIATAMLVFGLFAADVQAADSEAVRPVGPVGAAREPASPSILSANYAGTVNDRVAQIEATLRIAATKPDQTLPLFGEDVAVQEFSVKSGDAKLVRNGSMIAVRLGKRSDAMLQVKFVAKISGDVTKRQLAFAIPAALTTQVAFTLDQAEADVEFPTAISSKRTSENDKTRVEAIIGSGEHVELLWTPRVKRAAEVAATVFCQNTALATVGGGVVSVRSVLDYQVAQGELRQLRVQLPAGQRLLRVEGDGIRTWELKDEQAPLTPSLSPSDGERVAARPAEGSLGQVLVVELLKGVSPSYRLTLETERALDTLPTTAAIETPHALDVKRESGLIGLRSAEEVTLSIESAREMQRVDAEEFERAGVLKGGGLFSAFRFLKPGFELRAHAETVQPQIEAVVRNSVRVAADQVSLSATIDYTIKRAGVFNLRVALPAGYRVEQVAGTNVAQWSEREATPAEQRASGILPEGPISPSGGGEESAIKNMVLPAGSPAVRLGVRMLEVALKERTSGNCTLKVELIRHFSDRERSPVAASTNATGTNGASGVTNFEAAAGGDRPRSVSQTGVLPKSLAIAGVQPRDTVKLTGFVSVVAEPGVALKTQSFDGLTEIPAVSLPDGSALGAAGGVLAFKFIAAEPRSTEAWKLTVATSAIEAWVRAEIASTLTLSETLVSGRAQVRFDIANAPVKSLCLRIPAALKNVDISGLNIRRRDQQGEVWCVELQNKTRGLYTLNVTWEQPRTSKTNFVEPVGISADGVERETGFLAIAAQPPLQVDEAGAVDLARVDPREFPDWAGKPDEATVLAYRYVRPGYRLAIAARRFQEAQVLQALLDTARFTTVVAEDGQAMTEMSLSVRNNGRQFLEIELPPGAQVWSAFIAGQPVRPSKRDGKLLLPLQEWGADDEAVTVDLTYVGTNQFPRLRGEVAFVSPKFDAPLKNAHWELYLPPDYAYDDFAGTMAREVAAKPSLLSFGLSEYAQMERKSKAASRAEAQKDVSKAQSNLSSGNVREAVQNYNRAKGSLFASQSEAGQVRQLEQQLRNAQASNLINAQQAFSFANNGTAAEPAQQQISAARNDLNYDNAAAEAQWTKLAQAQEVATAKVQPLRVNLPLRGLRYSFAQVLQTEINKPLTVHFSAANTRTGNWLTRIGLGLVSFAALWAVVAFVTSRKARAEI